MAFSSTITSYGKSGDKIVTKGTFTASGSETGGDINTGLTVCESMYLQPKSSAPAEQCAIDETFPCDGSAVTIVTTTGVDGYWRAEGY
jgi:hypothetical protein